MRIEPFTLIRGRHPFVTVEELRRDSTLLLEPKGDWTGPRFEGSTTTSLVEKYCPKERPILECGPIWGKFTEWLQNYGYRDVRVLDFADMLRWGDRAKMQFAVTDFNKDRMPYADNTIGSAVAWGICEHLENPFHAAREVARVLKPGGVFVMAIPNVFHIVSKLVFLRRGMFPRWSYGNNHISILPHGVFEKTILRDFTLVETRYYKPFLHWLGAKAKYLPANEWFSDYVAYVLVKK